MKLHVLGGAYQESCFKPGWNEKYGSGLRAVGMLSAMKTDLTFVSIYDAESEIGKHINYLSKIGKYTVDEIAKHVEMISFNYLHPLSTPFCTYPAEKRLMQKNIVANYKCDNLLKYGILEGAVQTQSKRVVYDPQDPYSPKLFSADNSVAGEIVYILNRKEAEKVTGRTGVEECANFILEQVNVVCCIIKCDAEGAYVATKIRAEWVPVYATARVWLIGSGDVFSAAFFYHWIEKKLDFFKAAERASFYTAYYSESRTLNFSKLNLNYIIKNFNPEQLIFNNKSLKHQIYIAAPFFNIQQFDFLNEIVQFLKGKRLKVLSPFHNIGTGEARFIANEDLKEIKNSKVVFALLDDLDPGTIFEIGYARALGIPVVIYSETLTQNNETMFIGSGCERYDDISTAVYQLVWKLNRK